eukprot:581338-Hanusia_phi.AAC.7
MGDEVTARGAVGRLLDRFTCRLFLPEALPSLTVVSPSTSRKLSGISQRMSRAHWSVKGRTKRDKTRLKMVCDPARKMVTSPGTVLEELMLHA